MLIVADRVNTSYPGIDEAIETRNVRFIQDVARSAAARGAHMIDLNCGTRIKSEGEDLEWLVGVTQEATGLPMSIDTPNPVAMRQALEVHNGRALLNSATAEKVRCEQVFGLAKEFNSMVVGLAMDEDGIPPTVQGRLQAAGILVETACKYGVDARDLYLDPLVMPVGVDSQAGRVVLNTLRAFKKEFPECRTICGIGNISFGLPAPSLLNEAMTLLALGAGLDAVLTDTDDEIVMALLTASHTLLGEDEFCLNYISAYREGKLDAWLKETEDSC